MSEAGDDGDTEASSSGAGCYWPGEAWRVSTPEVQGISSSTLARCLDWIASHDKNLNSLLVVRNGFLVFEVYLGPHRPSDLHDIASATKSVTSILVGIALKQGLLPGLQAPLYELFTDFPDAFDDPRKREITVEHLLTMTSGLQWRESQVSYTDRTNTFSEMSRTPDWTAFALRRPLASPPGRRFNYNSGNSHLLSAILQRVTGRTAFEFAQEHLFGPLAIEEFGWRASPESVTMGSSALRLPPRSMARIGYLYLRSGEWNGEELVSPDYVRASTASRTAVGIASSLRYRIWRITGAALGRDRSLDLRLGYGYQWFILPSGGFAARGYGGQAIFVFPEKDLVVVMTGGLPPRDTFLPEWLIERFLLPAVRSDSALAEDVAEEVPPATAEAAPPIPGLGGTDAPAPPRPVLKQRYRMLPNASRVKRIELDLPQAGSGTLMIEQGEQATRVEIGLDGEYRYTEFPDGTLTAVRGWWQDEKTFRMESHSLVTGDRYDWTFTFEGETLVAESRGTIGQSVARVRGRVAGDDVQQD